MDHPYFTEGLYIDADEGEYIAKFVDSLLVHLVIYQHKSEYITVKIDEIARVYCSLLYHFESFFDHDDSFYEYIRRNKVKHCKGNESINNMINVFFTNWERFDEIFKNEKAEFQDPHDISEFEKKFERFWERLILFSNSFKNDTRFSKVWFSKMTKLKGPCSPWILVNIPLNMTEIELFRFGLTVVEYLMYNDHYNEEQRAKLYEIYKTFLARQCKINWSPLHRPTA